MKYNLKELIPCGCSFCKRWKEGFEKELRERIEQAFAEPSDEMDKLENAENLLDEILGDE